MLNVMTTTFNNNELEGLGLNLLLVLSIMARERSVTATARRIGVGGPAVSMALQRLRNVIDDPLFVRTKQGMIPTARALQLIALVDPFLTQMRISLAAPATFNPHTTERTVRIAIADDLEAVILPGLLEALRSQAPGLTLIVRDANYQAIDAIIASGDADIVVSAILNEHPTRAPHRILYRDHFVALFDPSQLDTAGPLELGTYTKTPQILVSPRGETSSPMDRVLEELGVSRNIVAVTSKFSNIPPILQRSALLCNIPSRSALVLAKTFGLMASPLPFSSPEINIGLAWQVALERDPLADWLIGLIVSQFESVHPST
ncbi:LysR substrate-binding domain-containing protein [Gluconobacter cerinus]|nr:LysR substrate-binding domain-containing protein [Gluconobacter cerinus]